LKSLLVPLALLLGITAYAETTSALRIGKVTVHALNVYAPSEVERGRFYSLADRLHIETKEAVIAQFLLFHEGEVFRPERLAETERNLRALRFLKSVSVSASPPHDGLVDVTVVTQDAWSIQPETQGGSKGGQSTYGLELSDSNLLGLGKDLAIGWHKDLDRRRLLFNYTDPAFFAPYWRAHFSHSANSDGYRHEIAVGKPFYSFTTASSVQFAYDGFRQDDHLYRDSFESARFQQQHRALTASYGRAIEADDQHARRLVGGIRFIDDHFMTRAGRPSGILPDERGFRYLFARYETSENDYLKLNFVNMDVRYEDFNLGRQVAVEAGVSPRKLGALSNSACLRLAGSDGYRLGTDAFLLAAGSLATRLDGGPQNAIASEALTFVRRRETAHPSTTVARVVAHGGWRADRDVQFFADAYTGLRGYRAHAFAGTRAVVINVEQRLYLGREILQLASPGLVAFIDSGNATDGGLGKLLRFKTDVGIGIRVGLPRTPKNLLRIDLAYALNRDGRGRRGLVISVASGQAF
jgi:hypothetical protein